MIFNQNMSINFLQQLPSEISLMILEFCFQKDESINLRLICKSFNYLFSKIDYQTIDGIRLSLFCFSGSEFIENSIHCKVSTCLKIFTKKFSSPECKDIVDKFISICPKKVIDKISMFPDLHRRSKQNEKDNLRDFTEIKFLSHLTELIILRDDSDIETLKRLIFGEDQNIDGPLLYTIIRKDRLDIFSLCWDRINHKHFIKMIILNCALNTSSGKNLCLHHLLSQICSKSYYKRDENQSTEEMANDLKIMLEDDQRKIIAEIFHTVRAFNYPSSSKDPTALKLIETRTIIYKYFMDFLKTDFLSELDKRFIKSQIIYLAISPK